MRRSYLVAMREFSDNLKTKTFWIGIFSFPVLLILFIVVPSFLERAREVRRYAVLDRSGWLLKAVEDHAAMPDLKSVFTTLVKRYRTNPASIKDFPQSLQKLAPVLAQLNDEQIRMAAEKIAGIFATAGSNLNLPADAVRALEQFRDEIRTWWKQLPPDEAARYGRDLSRSRYLRVDIPTDVKDPEKWLNEQVKKGELFAYFIINENPVENCDGCRYVSKNLTDTDLYEWFTSHASAVVRSRRLAEKGIDEAVARWIESPLRFEKTRVTATGKIVKARSTDIVRQWAPVAFVYLLWVSIFTSAQMLLTNTIEEKSNRIIEVLLSSVSPLELMTGKILGIAASGLTMVASWVVSFVLGIRFLPHLLHTPLKINFNQILSDPVYITSFLFYYLLGYILYASILVALGSVCNSLKEAQNLMQPVVLLLMIPFFTMVPIARDPNGTLARLLSYVPLFTPFTMMNRAAGEIPLYEYFLTTLLLLATIVIAFWGAARIFRIGILMYGKPPRLREILRLIRLEGGSPPPSLPAAESSKSS